MAPLVAGLVVVAQQLYIEGASVSLGVMGYPPLILGLMCAFIAWRALKIGERAFLYVAALYLVGVVLTFGADPSTGLSYLNWNASGILLIVGVVALAIVRKNMGLAIVSVVLLAVGCTASRTACNLVQTVAEEPFDVFALILGGGITILCMLFAKAIPRFATMVGTLFLAVFLVRLQLWNEQLVLSSVIISGILAAGVWYRAKDWFPAAVLCFPLLRELYLFVRKSGDWQYVLISFVLLAAGAVASLRKSTNKTPAPEIKETPSREKSSP